MSERNRPTHPRPQLRRRWTSLDGKGDFALDPEARWTTHGEVNWGRAIRVPFVPETAASGVRAPGFCKRCWYRLRLPPQQLAPDDRLHVHFGAVDYELTVWANGVLAGVVRYAARRGWLTAD